MTAVMFQPRVGWAQDHRLWMTIVQSASIEGLWHSSDSIQGEYWRITPTTEIKASFFPHLPCVDCPLNFVIAASEIVASVNLAVPPSRLFPPVHTTSYISFPGPRLSPPFTHKP